MIPPECDNKLQRVIDKQQDMNEVLIRNTTSLEYHIKRTNLLEEQVKKNTSFQNKLLGAFILMQIAIPLIIKYLL